MSGERESARVAGDVIGYIVTHSDTLVVQLVVGYTNRPVHATCDARQDAAMLLGGADWGDWDMTFRLSRANDCD
eukprot:1180482-Prorocentrum_minimum.AAC.1